MGRELYENEPVFREALDLCAQHLLEPLGIDLRNALYRHRMKWRPRRKAESDLDHTARTFFAVEYALAQWWISLGVEPAAMVGHSIGEYVALAWLEFFPSKMHCPSSPARGRLIYDLPAGSMLAVPLAADEIKLNGTLSVAVVKQSGDVRSFRTDAGDRGAGRETCKAVRRQPPAVHFARFPFSDDGPNSQRA